MPNTLFDRIWDEHVVREVSDGKTLLHVDRHVLHDLTSPQAFTGLREAGRRVRNPELTAATEDHIIATTPGRGAATYAPGESFVRALRKSASETSLVSG